MTGAEIANKAITNVIVDPVCGMNVPPSKTDLVASYQGSSYYFCAEACRKAFEKEPQRYLESRPAKRKGWIGRYLDRMAKANKEEFGGKTPTCCH